MQWLDRRGIGTEVSWLSWLPEQRSTKEEDKKNCFQAHTGPSIEGSYGKHHPSEKSEGHNLKAVSRDVKEKSLHVLPSMPEREREVIFSHSTAQQ